MRPALLIAAKDLRQRLRDRSALVIAVVVPLALAGIFALILGGGDQTSVRFNYAVVARGAGPLGRGFTEQALGPLERRGLVEVRRAGSRAEGRQLAENGDVAATFYLPPGFSTSAKAGRAARVEVIGNANSDIGVQVARSIADTFAARLTGTEVAIGTVLGTAAASAPPRELTRLGARAAKVPPPVTVADISAADRQLDPKTASSAGMAVFFLFFTVTFGVSSLIDERRDGTLARLLVAPIHRTSVLVGKALTSIVLGLFSMTVLVVATSLLLGAHWGNPVGVGALVFAGVLAATAIMAIVATLARTSEQASQWQSIVALVLGLLGGSFFAVSQAGGLLAQISALTPHYWFLRGLGDASGGAGPTAALPAAGVLLIFATVAGTIAILRSRRLVTA